MSGRPAPVAPELIARIGRQVLEGLDILRRLGIPHPHLHTGNILIDVRMLPALRAALHSLSGSPAACAATEPSARVMTVAVSPRL